MLILLTVGNTNQRGDFYSFFFIIFYFFFLRFLCSWTCWAISFKHFLPPHPLLPVCLCCRAGAMRSLAPGEGPGLQRCCALTLGGPGLVAGGGGTCGTGWGEAACLLTSGAGTSSASPTSP